MARSTSRLTAAWLGALLVAGLSGCGSGSEAAAPPAPAPTVSASASVPSAPERPVVVAPERPAAMDDDGPAGAEAAARYFLELDSYMQATGDTAEWEAMSHAECSFCATRLEHARRLVTEKATYEGGAISATVTHVYAQDATTGIWPLDVTIHQGTGRVIGRDGGVLAEIPAGVDQLRVEAARRDARWVIVGVADAPE